MPVSLSRRPHDVHSQASDHQAAIWVGGELGSLVEVDVAERVGISWLHRRTKTFPLPARNRRRPWVFTNARYGV